MKKAAEPVTLEQRIATALAADITSGELAKLVAETESAIIAADRDAAAARERAHDPALSPDPASAYQAMQTAAFVAERLRTLLPRLRQRLQDVSAAEELAQWQADAEQVQAQVEAAEKFAAQYPKLAAELLGLFRLAEEVDREVARVNSSAPIGAHGRLRQVELVARGLDAYSRSAPSIGRSIRLPDWEDSGCLLWPPPQRLDPAIFAPVPTGVDPRLTTDRWEEVYAEQRERERQQQQREAVEAEAAKRAFYGQPPTV